MILGAPAIIYPKSIFGFFDSGDTIDINAAGAPVQIPQFLGFQGERSEGKIRFADLKTAQTSIVVAPQISYTQFGGNAQLHDLSSNSFQGYVRPTYVRASFYIRLGNVAGAVQLLTLSEYLETDAKLIGFDRVERPLFADEKYFAGVYDTANLLKGRVSMAVGRWFRCQVTGPDYTVGTINTTRLRVNCERDCRVYLESVSDLSSNPTFAITGGGQNFAVVASAPNGASLAATNGGTLLRGAGNQDISIITGRDFGGITNMQFKVVMDVEVPYEL